MLTLGGKWRNACNGNANSSLPLPPIQHQQLLLAHQSASQNRHTYDRRVDLKIVVASAIAVEWHVPHALDCSVLNLTVPPSSQHPNTRQHQTKKADMCAKCEQVLRRCLRDATSCWMDDTAIEMTATPNQQHHRPQAFTADHSSFLGSWLLAENEPFGQQARCAGTTLIPLSKLMPKHTHIQPQK